MSANSVNSILSEVKWCFLSQNQHSCDRRENQPSNLFQNEQIQTVTNRLPPRFLRAGSIGAASGLICFTGGGSCNLSSFCSISARMLSPTAPSDDSWKLSTRAARLHFAATRRAAFRRKSYIFQWHMQSTWQTTYTIKSLTTLNMSSFATIKTMCNHNINNTHMYTRYDTKNNSPDKLWYSLTLYAL